jgi:dCMP deaminase
MRFSPEFWMELAELYATQSSCKKAQVGCLLIKNRRLIAAGVNGTMPGDSNACEDAQGNTEHWRVNHAEMNAIAQAGERVKGCEAYVTLAPCYECAKNLILFGITKLYYSKVKPEYEDVLVYIESMGVATEEV